MRKWCREFKAGRTDVHDEQRYGRPSVLNGVSKTCIDKIVCAKWVPKMLAENHKQQRIEMMARNFWTPSSLGTRSGSTTRHRNETTVPSMETSRVAKGLEFQLSPEKNDGRVLGQKRAIVVRIHACWYNNQCGPLLQDIEEPSPRDSEEEERHALEGSVFSSGQRSSVHRPRNNELIKRFGWNTATHPPYSLDVAPSDYHLLPKLNKFLNGSHFRTGEELKGEVLSYLLVAVGEFYDSSLSCLKMYYSMPISMFCIVKNHWELYFTD
ncbi:hypothetical protein Trydic_g14386 [Trypoxylus dichotomus]